MDFTHRNYIEGEAIAAISTPLGEGGIAIVRLSGQRAIKIANRVFSKDLSLLSSHSIHYGHVLNQEKTVIDEVLLLLMRAPHTFTGEDTVEFHCHGGVLVSRIVLQELLSQGARLADPGEFTFKSFMNGKRDLVQAEAIGDLIGAKNEMALRVSEEQLQGNLSQKIEGFQRSITEIAAIIEAWVDFPEEGLEFRTLESLSDQLRCILSQMQRLEKTFHDGRKLKEGISLCLVGCPNVGKSSLMNALLDQDRAIVTNVAGTTRDILEEEIRINGLNFRLIDTAGIRETEEIVEKEGVKRSQNAFKRADLVLLVLDSSQGISPEDLLLIQEVPKERTIFVWNKIDIASSDLPSHHKVQTVVRVSAKNKEGIDALKAAIDESVWRQGPPSFEEVMLTNLRHKDALGQAIIFLKKVLEGMGQEISPEFLALDIRSALKELGKIIGTNIGEDILSAIFSKFCIGK